MGWFSSKKKTYVSSQVYSLAGDYKERQNYKRANILSIINNSSEGGDFGEHLFSTVNSSQLAAYKKFNIIAHKIDYWAATGQTKPKMELPSVTYDLSIKALLEEYLNSVVYIYDVSPKIWELRNELVRHFYEDNNKIAIMSKLPLEEVFFHLNNICSDTTNYYEENGISIKEEYIVVFESDTRGNIGDEAVYPEKRKIVKGNYINNSDPSKQGSLAVYLRETDLDTNEIIKDTYLFSSQNRYYGETLPLKYTNIVQSNSRTNTHASLSPNNYYTSRENIVIYFKRVKELNPNEQVSKTEYSSDLSNLNLDKEYFLLKQKPSQLELDQEILVEYFFDDEDFYIKEGNNFVPYELDGNVSKHSVKIIHKDDSLIKHPHTNLYQLIEQSDLTKALRILVEPYEKIKLNISDTTDGSDHYGKYLNNEFTEEGYIKFTTINNIDIFVKPTHYKIKNEGILYKITKYKNFLSNSPVFEEGPMEHIFYTKGEGIPSLDRIIDSNKRVSLDFAPVMPVRLYKRNIINNNRPVIAEKNNRLFNTLTRGNNYPTLIKNINSAKGIGDIENAYIIQGIPITTKDEICKEYLWSFFTEIGNLANDSTKINLFDDGAKFAEEVEKGNYFQDSTSKGGLYKLTSGKLIYLDGSSASSRTDVVAKYVLLNDPFSKNNRQGVYIQMGSMRNIGTLLTLSIQGIGVREGKGGYKGLKENQIRQEPNTIKVPYAILTEVYDKGQHTPILYTRYEVISLVKKTRGGYEIIDLLNASYDNEVLPGYWTGAHGRDVFNYDSEECPMIIPINNTLLSRMPVLDAIQVAANCSHIVFNTWKVVKTRWFQRGIFKAILVIGAIVVSIYFPPFGAAAGGAGILGANLAVGIAMGLAGTAALIGGAIANAVAAVVVSHIISKAVDKIFDGTLAIIVKMIASYAVAQIGSDTSFIDSLKNSFDNFLDVSNIIKGTDALANIYKNNKAQQLLSKQEELIKTMNEFQAKSEQMKKNMEELGFENSNFELASIYIDSKTNIPNESPEDFLARTLLSGSDIIEQSLRMIDSYVEIQLKQIEV